MGRSPPECRYMGSVYKIVNHNISFQINSNMKPPFIILLSITLLSTSCGKGGLTKRAAKNKISQSYGYPKVEEYLFVKSFYRNEDTSGNGVTLDVESDDLRKIKKMIDEFEKNNLLVFEETHQKEETTA